MSGLSANFVTGTSGMSASFPGELVFGLPGEAGGYYSISVSQPDEETIALALTIQDSLSSSAYAVTGARALRQATRLGVAIHLLGGILGLIIMLALGYLGSTQLLTPVNVLLYQLIWAVPGLLVTEWTRAL